MSDSNYGARHRRLKALVGGLLGFALVYLARALALVVALQAFGLVGGKSLSPLGQLALYVIVPLLLVTGAALTARSIGAGVRRSLIVGMAAAAIAITVQLSHNNYAPFDWLETAAFVAAAVVSAMLAVASRQSKWKTVVSCGVLGVGLLSVVALVPGLGFVVSLVAWLTLPVVATTIQY